MRSDINDSTIFDQLDQQSKTKQNLSKDLEPNSIILSKHPVSETKTVDEAAEKKSVAASRLKRLVQNPRRGSQLAESNTNRRSFENLKRKNTIEILNTTDEVHSKSRPTGSLQIKRAKLLTLNPEPKPKEKFIHNKNSNPSGSSKATDRQPGTDNKDLRGVFTPNRKNILMLRDKLKQNQLNTSNQKKQLSR